MANGRRISGFARHELTIHIYSSVALGKCQVVRLWYVCLFLPICTLLPGMFDTFERSCEHTFVVYFTLYTVFAWRVCIVIQSIMYVQEVNP